MPLPALVAPMLATDRQPPEGPRWAFEWKWDGIPAVVAAYPELQTLPGLVTEPVLLDGELVTSTPTGDRTSAGSRHG
ncbi:MULTISPECIES: hypothetical protein [Amycolatopsis]|uniref:hypothetical protein n=1 Tax=Amycolatopsis TaxID=1813 RepID=UPI0011778B37|nr:MULTISPECIES: hypothetical protein [Amycolatopsis]